MSELQLSSTTRALLEAARGDGPSAGTRAKIWNGVASTAGVGAAAATTSIAAGSTATVSASKLLAMGALLGSVVSVGVTLAVLRVAGPLAPRPVALPQPAMERVTQVVPNLPPPVVALGGPVARSSSLAAALAPLDPVAALGAAPSTPAHVVTASASPASEREPGMINAPPKPVMAARPIPKAVRSVPAPVEVAEEDPLMHEAALVAEARGSLVRGDPLGALRMAQAAGKLSSRGLEPEELSLQARALRALKRDTEADAVDGELRSRYPDHALSR